MIRETSGARRMMCPAPLADAAKCPKRAQRRASRDAD
jgi:hypothetical protein